MEGKEEMAKNPLKKKLRKILRKQIEIEKKKEKVKKKSTLGWIRRGKKRGKGGEQSGKNDV